MVYVSLWIRKQYNNEMENFRKMTFSEKVKYFLFVRKNRKESDLYAAVYNDLLWNLILIIFGLPSIMLLVFLTFSGNFPVMN